MKIARNKTVNWNNQAIIARKEAVNRDKQAIITQSWAVFLKNRRIVAPAAYARRETVKLPAAL